jgi:hypothetical protein
MNELIWKSEKEMRAELDKHISSWKPGFSKDGFVTAAEGTFSYKNILYLIKVIRYFNHTNGFVPMGSRISDKHVVVEYPEKTRELVYLIGLLQSNYEFLYHDTLHSYADNMTVEDQIKKCHEVAKRDIDSIPEIIREWKNKNDEIIKRLRKCLKYE